MLVKAENDKKVQADADLKKAKSDHDAAVKAKGEAEKKEAATKKDVEAK